MISQRYLLVVNIPIYAWQGERFADRLWLIDLIRHRDYLPNLVLLCPVAQCKPPADADAFSNFKLDGLPIIAMPYARSTLAGLFAGLIHFAAIWRAVRNADIVHASPIGWPIPLGYWAFLAARLQGRCFVCVIESTPWRAVPGKRQGVVARIRAPIMEGMARLLCANADLSLFTSEEFRRSLVPGARKNACVFKAVWLPRERIVAEEALKARLAARRGRTQLTIGFAGRLVPEKGIRVLLDAMAMLPENVHIELRILGDGPLREELESRKANSQPNVDLQVLGVVQYGADFDRELDSWDLAVIPSLSTEQPRIVFDCFGRGVPVVASDTPGLRECVREGVTGYLVPSGNPGALALCLSQLASQRAALTAAASAAVGQAHEFTHEGMHLDRERMIAAAWQDFTQTRVAHVGI